MLKLPFRAPSYCLFRATGWPRQLPLNLTLSVTFKCNSHCLTCNIHKKTSNELTLDEWCNVFHGIGKSPFWITISGGEPFLRRDLPALVRSLYNICRPAIITIPTNGLLTNRIPEWVDEIARHCADTLIIINLSVDELGSRHDEIRGVQGNFIKVMETFHVLKQLQLKNLTVGFHTVISGINSIWWAREGSQVTLVDHNRERIAFIEALWHELSLSVRLVYDGGRYTALPFEDQEFDMSWNFAALNSYHNPEELLQELARVSRKVMFICVPNPMNLFGLVFAIRQEETRLPKRRRMDSRKVQKSLTQAGWCVKESGYLDAPPWPDIAMTREDFLQKIGLKCYARRLKQEITPERRICILDYYSGRNKRMREEICKYALLENSPRWLKRIWAHHRYFVFIPRNRL